MLAGISLLFVGILAALALLARDEPSAEVGNTSSVDIPAVSADDGCQNFGSYWTQTSGAGVDPAFIETITNCRQQEDGSWFVATGPGDERLAPEERLSDEERAETAELRQTLLTQIATLESALPADLADQVEQIYSAEPRSVTGHIREGVTIGPTRTRYARVINAVTLDPDNQELADYVGWSMARRISAYGNMRRQCTSKSETEHLHAICRALEDQLSIRYAPWPWDLADPVLLETYLLQLARAGDEEDETEAESSAMLPARLTRG